MTRKQVIKIYRKMTLPELIDLKLNGSYVAGVLEQVICEKGEKRAGIVTLSRL